MLEKFKKLIDVKSIVTLVFTLVFSVLCFKGIIDSEKFISLYTMILAFYFGTQTEKNKNDKNEEK